MKNKWRSFFLCLFLGWLGVHRYYERKIFTGILYTLTLGVLGIGVVIDLWCILITPNKPVESSGQYNIYLNAIDMLQQNGYTVSEFERIWCRIRSLVTKDGKSVGEIFVVADPSPGVLSAIIGAIISGYKKQRYEQTSYGQMQRILELVGPRFERAQGDFNSCHYWPDESLVGGYMHESDDAEDNGRLAIFKSAID